MHRSRNLNILSLSKCFSCRPLFNQLVEETEEDGPVKPSFTSNEVETFCDVNSVTEVSPLACLGLSLLILLEQHIRFCQDTL